jgi:hypothetical protein
MPRPRLSQRRAYAMMAVAAIVAFLGLRTGVQEEVPADDLGAPGAVNQAVATD